MTYDSDAEAYEFAVMIAAEHFAQTHPDAFKRMATGAFLDYEGERGGFRKRMQELDRQAAIADGFPSYSVWLSSRTKAAA